MTDRRRGPETKTTWEIPDALFGKLHAEFRFGLDAASEKENAKVTKFLTGPCVQPMRCSCGLCTRWKASSVWLNPPYGPGEEICKVNCKKLRCMLRGEHCLVRVPGLTDWMAKCAAEAQRYDGPTVAAIVPNATDTRWFEEMFYTAWEIRSVVGRVQFKGSTDGGNPCGSLIPIWRPGERPYGQPVLSLYYQPEV